MNRDQLMEAARWSSVLKAIEMHRENKLKYPGFPFHEVFMSINGSDMQAEVLAMVEEHAKKKLAEHGVRDGAPLETLEAHRVEVRLGIRLQYVEKKIRELETRLETSDVIEKLSRKKWWSA